MSVKRLEEKNQQVVEMQKSLRELDGIQFEIEFYPDGNWTAESVNIDGIITGSKNVKDINSMTKDAIFTYFEIPAHLCNDSLVKANNEPIAVMQKVYA